MLDLEFSGWTLSKDSSSFSIIDEIFLLSYSTLKVGGLGRRLSERELSLLIIIVNGKRVIIAEAVGGAISGSLAILADASHLCCDLIGFGLSYTAVHLGQKGKTNTMTFGYHRIEVVGALTSVL